MNASITNTGGVNATQSGFAYGTSATLATVISTSTLGSQSGTASFLQNLTGLTTSTTYYVRAYATNTAGTGYGSIVSFTTSNNPPIIANISASATTTSATITWTTDEGSNSEVVYGTTTGYGSASSSASNVTSHSLTLTGLTASTTYDYEVVSTNGSSQTSTSTNQTLTTASGAADTTPPTEPTNLVATPELSSEISLSWTASTGNGVDPIAGYRVFRDGAQVATDTSGTTYNDTGLSPSTLHSYWVYAYDTQNNVSTSSAGVIAQSDAGADQYGTTWKPLRIGAGGFIQGIDIDFDGTMVIRTDVYGAYIWDGSQWDQLISTSSMPTAFVNTGNNSGVYELRIAPSNSNIMYMEYLGYVFRTTDRGVTWTKTNFSQVADGANDSYRGYGRKIAIDPVNPNVVYAGSPGQGVFATTDGGNTWSQVAAITSTTTAGYVMDFDPTSAVVDGRTQGIYLASYGVGVYHSTDGGQTWTLTSGTPTIFTHMFVAQDGTVYLVDDTNSNLHIYNSSSWSTVSTGTDNPWTVTVDPTNADRVIAMSDSGSISISTDHAVSFTGYSSMSRVSTDIPWLAWTDESYMSAGDIAFDPTVNNTLHFAEGIGEWVTNPSNSNSSVTWTDQSYGIEELVANEIVSPPGGHPLVFSWDRPVFYVTDPDTFPLTHGPNNAKSIIAGWSGDYASNDPNYIVGLMQYSAQEFGYSTNGGQTWQLFGSFPSMFGGAIAAASSTSIVVFPSNNGNPYYSTDGGQTWNQISISGVPTSGETGWGWAYYLDRQIVAADRVNIGTYYAYNYGPSGDSSAAGIYKSTDGGQTWTHVYSGILATFSGYNAKLRAVPGIAGELFFTGGQQSGDSVNSPANEPFMESTDGGMTWSSVPNVEEVYDFGFGKAAPGTTTPAIYIVGFVDNQYGIWESDDNAQTWTERGVWPLGSIDSVKAISGDMNAYGRIYVGFGGSGYAYGDTSSAQIPPIITSVASSTSGSSANVSWTTDQSSNSELVYGTTKSYGLSTSSATMVTSHSLSISGLASNTAYHFSIVSANAEGYTSTSTDETFVTPDTTPPSTPTGLSATVVSFNQINLSWSTSTSNGVDPVAGYQIFRGGAQVATDTSGTAYEDLGLSSSTAYTYNVTAYDTAENVSGQSVSATATTTSGSYDPATTAWVNAVETAGGSASATQEGYVDSLIKCYKSAGIFSLMDREWLLWSDDLQQAQIDIINDQSWTAHGTTGFIADAGWTGDGTTSYLDTGFVPSTAEGTSHRTVPLWMPM